MDNPFHVLFYRLNENNAPNPSHVGDEALPIKDLQFSKEIKILVEDTSSKVRFVMITVAGRICQHVLQPPHTPCSLP
jgi:hypothetical protein